MSTQDQIPEGSQNFMRVLSEEISEIKTNTYDTKSGIESVESKFEKRKVQDAVTHRKLDDIQLAVSNIPTIEEKRIVLFPEFANYNFYRIFFSNMFIWLAIMVISIVFLNKLFPLLKGDGHRYKNAWQELYSAAGKKEQYHMDSILFYTHGVKLDSIGKK